MALLQVAEELVGIRVASGAPQLHFVMVQLSCGRNQVLKNYQADMTKLATLKLHRKLLLQIKGQEADRLDLPIMGIGSYLIAKRLGAKSDMLISLTSLLARSVGRTNGAVCICDCSWCCSERRSPPFIFSTIGFS